ncbi:MAG: hypothetical protein JW870_12730 [Candidatus Delongbacteria bacterium]|nr:hypothetical protein [Candidatus Delongbacteria bacterium]
MDFSEIKNSTGAITLSQKELELIISEAIQSSRSSNVISVDQNSDISFNSATTNENFINEKRLKKLESEFTIKLKLFLVEENFEYGFENKADILLKEQMSINKTATKEWLNNIYVQNYSNHEIMIGILRLISRFEIEDVSPQGQTMAIAALAHNNPEVQECGIRAFESWCSIENIDLLKAVNVQQPWLKEYLNSVIKDIELEYGVAS